MIIVAVDRKKLRNTIANAKYEDDYYDVCSSKQKTINQLIKLMTVTKRG